MEREAQEARDRAEATSCNWLLAIFTLGIACIQKAKDKMRAENLAKQITNEKAELERTLTPLIAKLGTVDKIATSLWAAGTRQLEAVDNFLGAVENARDYFNSGGRLFHTAARKKHIKKLDSLIAACDDMLEAADADSELFKAFLTGSD